MAPDEELGYAPNYAVPPGETLLELIEDLGMGQKELAHRLGCTFKHVNEMVHGRASITEDMAVKLELVLGTPARFWSNRERRYREALARAAMDERLEAQTEWLKQVPLKDLIDRGHLPATKDKVALLTATLGFFGVASPEAVDRTCREPVAAYRTAKAFDGGPVAIAAWMRLGELKAREINCAPYDEKRFRAVLKSARDWIQHDPVEVFPQLVAACAGAGVALVVEPELKKTRLCGLARWLTPSKALIQLSLRHKTADNMWFTFYHEAGHLLLHGKRQVFIDEEGETGSMEHEADQFASDALIPPAAYQAFKFKGRFYQEDILAFAKAAGTAAGVVVGRLQHEGLVERRFYNGLKVSVTPSTLQGV